MIHLKDKLQFITSYFENITLENGFIDISTRIRSVFIFSVMGIIALGIFAGTQLQNGRFNINSRASGVTSEEIWAKSKPNINGTYLWEGGPTTAWESYIGNRVNICNGKSCWTLMRVATGVMWENGGTPFEMDQNETYKSTLSAPNGKKIWEGGPTAAWTWEIPNGTEDTNRLFPELSKETIINESFICNGNYCWRYVLSSKNKGFWRDGGQPVNLATTDIWKDQPSLYTNNGPTVGWTDPQKKLATICNGTFCKTINYTNWQWQENVNPNPIFPSGVTQYTAAWTSLGSNIINLATGANYYKYEKNELSSSSFLMGFVNQVTRNADINVPTLGSQVAAQPNITNTPIPSQVLNLTQTPTTSTSLSASQITTQPIVTNTPSPTYIPTRTPTPTSVTVTGIPTPTPTTITSKIYVTVYSAWGTKDHPIDRAKVKVYNMSAGGTLIGEGLTNSDGKSPTWIVPANSNIDAYAYPADPSSGFCGSKWSFNTGVYGNLHSQLLRIYLAGQVPCYQE